MEWLTKDPVLIWFLVGLVLMISEFIIPGLIIIFFGIGAWMVAVVLLAINLKFFLQIFIFLAGSVASLLLLRKKFTVSKDKVVNVTDDFIGKTARVQQGFSKGEFGRVFFKGTSWKAETTSDKPIEEGTYVRITGYDSIVLKVERLE
ncbi:MAG: NfeD family protein [Desulfobacterales bacterium]|nr:NfeD family protein [Desulfobacterales bacterium]